MKKYSLAFSLLFVSLVFAFFSCKKINEATELGGDLIPAVDNVHTFEVSLNSLTRNGIYDDSSRVAYTDLVALGDINEPEFGHMHANFNFNINPSIIGTYPFLNKADSLKMDSVVLQLAYQDAYGDTLGNGVQTVTVYEIDPNSGFRTDTLYKYKDASTDNMAGQQLSVGSKTYTIRNLKDSITLTRPLDTSRVANVVRIKLDTSLGRRFARYDTTSSSTTGAFNSDSLFHTLFKGLAIKASNTGQALSYFNLTDAKTKLTVYYKYKLNGVDTSASLDFYHLDNGQSNYVSVPPSGNWQSALAGATGDKLYLQTSPSGAYAAIKVPALDTFSNKVIHRAEIVATRLPTSLDGLYAPPAQLIIDRINVTHDTAFILQNDLTPGADGSISFAAFGGNLRASDNTYRMNITRYVQSIVTKHVHNDTLRLYAPLRTVLFASNLPTTTSTNGSFIAVPVTTQVGFGRVVLAGGTYSDPNVRLHLRIIYSNL